ncbi:MAG: hypothetical protein QM820_63590 [Minicystis sp.]
MMQDENAAPRSIDWDQPDDDEIGIDPTIPPPRAEPRPPLTSTPPGGRLIEPRPSARPESSGTPQPPPQQQATPTPRTARVEAGGARDRRPLDEDEIRCVIMGASQAGKTTLLGAIAQACSHPRRDPEDYHLKFLVGERGTGTFIRRAYQDMLLGAPGDATHDVQRYRFTARVTRPGTFWRPADPMEATLTINDGPGGALFPDAVDSRIEDRGGLTHWEESLIEDAASAGCLVLCVDCSVPDTDLVLSQLADRLRDFSSRAAPTTTEPVAETWGQRLYRRVERLRGAHRPRRRVAERWLNADRFLVLLTKVDVLAEHVAAARDRASGAPAGTTPPSAVAAVIDPVRQACALLGEVFLQQILGSLRPGAALAVGLTSARGFDSETGRPFRARAAPTWDDDDPEGADDDPGSDAVEPPAYLKDWAPVGLRDAVIFMVRGEARGVVRTVDEGALLPGLRRGLRATDEQIAHRIRAELAW